MVDLFNFDHGIYVLDCNGVIYVLNIFLNFFLGLLVVSIEGKTIEVVAEDHCVLDLHGTPQAEHQIAVPLKLLNPIHVRLLLIKLFEGFSFLIVSLLLILFNLREHLVTEEGLSRFELS